jgi:DNA-binding GntR family transcriptional regulator
MKSGLHAQVMQPVVHEPLHQKVHQELRRSLMEGRFKPGQILTIRDLATQLGTTIMPVRDALKKLMVEQALELTNSRSVCVPVISAERFGEICDARVVLEGCAARLAAERATANDIARAEEAEDDFLNAHATGDPSLLLEKNRKFHFAIYSAARHETLLQLIEPLWVRCGPCTLALFEELTAERVKWGASTPHRKAVDALRCRKPDQAEAAIVQDIRATCSRYQQHAARMHAAPARS